MTGERDDDAADREGRDLWQQIAVPPREIRPDPADLAAFLDGEASSAQRARIEAWLARDPGAAEELALLSGSPEPAPLSAAASAAARRLVSRPGLLARVRGLWQMPALVAGTACLGLWLGFGIGGEMFDAQAGTAEALAGQLFGEAGAD